jgi:hypothetical protein
MLNREQKRNYYSISIFKFMFGNALYGQTLHCDVVVIDDDVLVLY